MSMAAMDGRDLEAARCVLGQYSIKETEYASTPTRCIDVFSPVPIGASSASHAAQLFEEHVGMEANGTLREIQVVPTGDEWSVTGTFVPRCSGSVALAHCILGLRLGCIGVV